MGCRMDVADSGSVGGTRRNLSCMPDRGSCAFKKDKRGYVPVTRRLLGKSSPASLRLMENVGLTQTPLLARGTPVRYVSLVRTMNVCVFSGGVFVPVLVLLPCEVELGSGTPTGCCGSGGGSANVL